MTDKAGDEFFQKTKYQSGQLPRHTLDWDSKPPVLKDYSSAPKVSLPPPKTSNGPDLWQVLESRRSVRAYTEEPLTRQQISQLLWATQGITAEVSGTGLRTAPSAGALYPIETYLCINDVKGLDSGLYHYDIKNHGLDVLKEGDFSRDMKRGALDQQMAQQAAVVFIWSAVFQRSKWKYLQRAYRYILLDAGHVAQNLALAAEGMGLGSCQIGALYDDQMNRLLELDGSSESVIYLSSVGYPKRKRKRT